FQNPGFPKFLSKIVFELKYATKIAIILDAQEAQSLPERQTKFAQFSSLYFTSKKCKVMFWGSRSGTSRKNSGSCRRPHGSCITFNVSMTDDVNARISKARFEFAKGVSLNLKGRRWLSPPPNSDSPLVVGPVGQSPESALCLGGLLQYVHMCLNQNWGSSGRRSPRFSVNLMF
ncbi:hypothetical protein CSKR_109531, partial [Clonorchis sinensis]